MNEIGRSKAPSEIADGDLPMAVVDRQETAAGTRGASARKRGALPKYFLLPFIPLLLFTGAVIGIYVQPPALRVFLNLTGLKPGGGTSNPIAIPAEEAEKTRSMPATIRSVVALGRLLPDGKVVTISPPYGAGDARIEEITVSVGSVVQRGDVLARLDNSQSLEAAVASAEANVELQEATLEQTRRSIIASFEEAKAALERAQSGEKLATQNLARHQKLHTDGATTQAELDQATAVFQQAQRDVAQSLATVSRYESQEIEEQSDVVVAARKLNAANADLNRSRRDLARGVVTAPVSGTVLDIFVRPGEKPGASGILDIGNIQRMTAELEVYQSEIGRVAIGQSVEITADAIKQSFHGTVAGIGFEVERQTIVQDDPAANTDARVIKVKVVLDNESSHRAAKFTNLEVTGRIAVEDLQ